MIEAGQDVLILKRASASRPSGQWNDDDFDVLAGGAVVGRIFKANAAPVGSPWMWTLAFGYHEDRTPTHGYAATREAAMRAFAKSWRREGPRTPEGLERSRRANWKHGHYSREAKAERRGSATRTSSTRCAIPSWPPIGTTPRTCGLDFLMGAERG
jgi:hypothetical protein